MDKRIVIGLVGKQGSGKGYFIEVLQMLLSGRITKVKSGGILIDLLKILNLPVTRQNLQKMVNCLKDNFGGDIISKAVYARILATDSEVIIFDAVRWKSDEEMIRRFENGLIVYIDTEKEIRYQRLKNRGEKEDERGLGREKFEKAELDSTEIDIPDIGSRADVVITNNGTENEFAGQIRDFCSKYLWKRL